MLVAERFLQQELVRKYGKHPVSTDGGVHGIYPHACKLLNMNHHHLHSSYEKSMIERTIQYIKRIEPKALMTTTFLVEKKNVNYKISEIG
jgi:putative transposase